MRGQLGIWGLCGVFALGCGGAESPVSATPRSLTLLHTSDLHSRLWPFRSRISRFEAELGLGPPLALSEVGGVARLGTLLTRERARGPTLWLDSGDALEGAEVFQRYGGHVELELLSALGLSAMALGNHELSLSATDLSEVLGASARFAVLSANVVPRADSPLFGRVLSSAVLRVAGVQVGVIGLANPHSPPNLQEPGNPWGLTASPELAEAAQHAIDELLPRVALVVVLSHLGLDQDHAFVAGTTGVDLVLGGHQHVVTPEPEWQDDCTSPKLQAERGCTPRRVPIVHSGAYSQWLSRLELRVEPDRSQPEALEIEQLSLVQLPLAETVLPDPEVARFLEQRRRPPEPPLAYLPNGVARRSALGADSPLGNLATDAMRATTAAEVVLLNTSGLRDDLEPGELLRSDLELVFPFVEAWRLVWLSGRVLRQGLERAAWRSAVQDCVSTLQVSGLKLELHCAACRARQGSCLEIRRDAAGDAAHGTAPLEDSALVLTALPEYLTLPGADFEAVGGSGAALDGDVASILARHFQTFSHRTDLAACRASLRSASDARCREAFGALSCPLDQVHEIAICSALPSVKGERDGRIEMLP